MQAFAYSRPATVADAVRALAAQEDARALAGGQTLLQSMKLGMIAPTALVDLNGIAELKGIRVDAGSVTIGAGTTHAEVAASPEVRRAIPALAELAGLIGDRQVRHRGTLGGSLANNDPAACYPAAVLALGATVVTDRREIAADDFFVGVYATALDDGELVTAVRFPVPQRAGWQKFRQPASRFSLVGVFVADFGAGPMGARIAVTGAGSGGVFRATGLEPLLQRADAAQALQAASVPAEGLGSDLHASAEYRAALIPVLAARALG